MRARKLQLAILIAITGCGAKVEDDATPECRWRPVLPGRAALRALRSSVRVFVPNGVQRRSYYDPDVHLQR